MRKFLPFIAVAVGILVLVGGFFLIRSKRNTNEEEEGTSVLVDVPLEKRPVASLTPTDDGHWLKLKIEKIMVEGAASLDYELLYSLPDGRTQGVPGSVELKGSKSLERDLLLGSESSGKFRYDEGVEEGTLTLRFRNEKGKLITKFSTKFHLQAGRPELTSLDSKFTYKLSKSAPKVFFVTMETFGIPADAPGKVSSGPFGVFSSSESALSGEVSLFPGDIYRFEGASWTKLENGSSDDIGYFITTQ